MEIKRNPPVDAPAGLAVPGRPERVHDPETHQRCAPVIRSKGQYQRSERRIGRLGTIELDRRLELQGDNIGARIAPGDTGAYRRTVGLHYLGRISRGKYLLGGEYQIVPPQGVAQRR
jgi:hypothetical protein